MPRGIPKTKNGRRKQVRRHPVSEVRTAAFNLVDEAPIEAQQVRNTQDARSIVLNMCAQAVIQSQATIQAIAAAATTAPAIQDTEERS